MIRLRRESQTWREATFAVLDFETTGLEPGRDHVLSFGVVPIALGRVRLAGALYRVVRPPIGVPADSIRVHGIRPLELERAPELGDVVAELEGALSGRVLVAHAAGVELSFLARLPGGTRRWPRSALDVVDLALELARREQGSPVDSPRLSDLAARYGVPVGRTHHAFVDALVTAQLFVVLATRLEHLGAGSLRDLERTG